MKMRSTYTAIGWDFVGETNNGTHDIWRMCKDGIDFPRLAWEYARMGDYACPDGAEMADLLELAMHWLNISPDLIGKTDGTGDGAVNYEDFGLLGENWLYRRIPNLVLDLPLDGDYLSSIGGYSGTPQGDPEFVGETEAQGGKGALQLDENDSVVINGYTGISGSRARTCMAWIKTERAENSLFGWGGWANFGGYWHVRINGGRLRLNINKDTFIQTTTAVNTGQWVHVAIVLPDRTDRLEDIRLYVNGILELNPVIYYPSSPGASINTDATIDFQIGKIRDTMGFIGLIDNIRIYDCALSQEEIATVTGSFCADAGQDQYIDLQEESHLTLVGTLFNASDSVDVTLEKVGGPNGSVIADPTALTTMVEFSREGNYVFRLTAVDNGQTISDEIAVTVTNGEIGYWRFDGNFSDLFGHHGNGGYHWFVKADLAKVGNGAIILSTGNDWLQITGFHGVTGSAARTCMAWIKTTGVVAPIVYWGDKNTAGAMWDMRVGSLGQLRLVVGGGPVVDSATVVNTGQWVHVAAVLPEGAGSTADVRLYVNGVRETGVIMAGTINTKAGLSMRIGADDTGKYFTGLIDDVRVYDRALTAEEIVAAMGQ